SRTVGERSIVCPSFTAGRIIIAGNHTGKSGHYSPRAYGKCPRPSPAPRPRRKAIKIKGLRQLDQRRHAPRTGTRSRERKSCVVVSFVIRVTQRTAKSGYIGLPRMA